MLGFSKEKICVLLVTGTERTTRRVRKVEGDEEMVIAVEEVTGLIVLDKEGTREVGKEEV